MVHLCWSNHKLGRNIFHVTMPLTIQDMSRRMQSIWHSNQTCIPNFLLWWNSLNRLRLARMIRNSNFQHWYLYQRKIHGMYHLRRNYYNHSIASKRKLLCWSAFAIETMFDLETKCIHFLRIMDPCTLNHPNWSCFTFASDHQKYRTARFIKCIIHIITLNIKMKNKLNNCYSNIDFILNVNRYVLVSMSIGCFHWNDLIFVQTTDLEVIHGAENVSGVRLNFHLYVDLSKMYAIPRSPQQRRKNKLRTKKIFCSEPWFDFIQFIVTIWG